MSIRRAWAAGILGQYLRVAFEANGEEWTADNEQEMATLVDLIVDEAVKEAGDVAADLIEPEDNRDPRSKVTS